MTIERRPFWRPLAVAWVILALLGAAWTFATPIGAAPDEPAHLIRAASVVTGQFTPFEHKNSEVIVPEYIWYSQASDCFIGQINRTPRCLVADPHHRATATVSATSGRYNPLYSILVGWPSLMFHSSAGIYAMRIVSDVLVALFLALSFALISTWRRAWLPMIGLATAATPMVFFLSGVVNPNSLEITSTLAAFIGMLTIVREPSTELLTRRVAIVFVSASVAANMRPLSLLWVAVAILSPLVLTDRSTVRQLLRARAVRAAIVGCAVAFSAALVWWIVANPLRVGTDEAGTFEPQQIGTSHLAGFFWTLFSSFYYGQQVVGAFGWLETPAPLSVYFVWAVLVGALTLLAFCLARRRALVFSAVLMAAVLVLPAAIQGYYVTTGGVVWQGRYILPLFACAMVGLATVVADQLHPALQVRNRLLATVLVTWAVAEFLAFATTLKRYAAGASPQWPSMFHPLWQPPATVNLLLVVFSVVVGAAAIAIYRMIAADAETPPVQAARAPDRAIDPIPSSNARG